MAVLRFLATATACAGAAFAIGHFMESGVSRAAATPVDLPQTFAEAPMLIAAATEPAPVATAVFDRPNLSRSPDRLPGLDTHVATSAADGCQSRLTATPRPGAIAALRFTAPCAPEARVTLHHQGLTVTLLTDAEGEAEALFPALSREAVFMAEAAGVTAVARTVLPDMAQWRRVALQWRDGDGLSLHALAPGARHGAAGHVSRATPVAAGNGPSMVALGHPAVPEARLAEIYSAPAQDAATLSVEIDVAARNCGAAVMAELVQADAAGGLTSTDLEVTLPGCDAVGELLVLQNLEAGRTLAAR
ncbi:hypothetical protein [Limimaricola hongkongensis]|uniref:Translocase n=1 Tax=Limimaricola hongkongensis DSM 17492 TaxID=1122180 RepID=A0A017HFE6_9RHOB|nr:hypothetical protein [Limimaricola hongkongensis]EYD73237.1 hypothetical protein Lokhon_00764 [Limimaricola hongkongensis DSM 17492]